MLGFLHHLRYTVVLSVLSLTEYMRAVNSGRSYHAHTYSVGEETSVTATKPKQRYKRDTRQPHT